MAVVGANVLVNGTGVGATSFTTASFTPAANTLYLASFTSRTGITADPTQPTCTGAGLTWVLVGTVVYDNTSSSRRRLTVFLSMGAGSAGGLTFDEAGQSQTAADWSIDSFTGVDTTGTNGSGAVVQSVTNFDGAGTATTLTATLAAFSNVNNATYGSFGFGNPTGTATVGSGFTMLSDFTEGSAACRINTEWKNTNDTTVDITYTAGGELGIVAAEIAATAVVGTSTASTSMMMGV